MQEIRAGSFYNGYHRRKVRHLPLYFARRIGWLNDKYTNPLIGGNEIKPRAFSRPPIGGARRIINGGEAR